MSTIPIRFTDNTQGSASVVTQAFNELRKQGNSSLINCETIREQSLISFSNALSSLNEKKTRVNRLASIDVPIRFVTTDLADVDQSITTAALRADAGAVTLKERNTPAEATIFSIDFTASNGTLQTLSTPQIGTSNQLNALYRVATSDGSIPIGTFTVKLLDPISISLLIFDMFDTPSAPTINVSISLDNVTYINALSSTQNGYRVASWFTPTETQYIKIQIIPALPDILNGSTYTFGLTDLYAYFVQYELSSDWYTLDVEGIPIGPQWQFNADTIPGVSYYLSIENLPYVEVVPGDIVTLPSISADTTTAAVISSGSIFTLPSNAYISTLVISDDITLEEIPIAVGLLHTSDTSLLTRQYIAVEPDGNLFLVVYTDEDFGRNLNISYVTGPATINAKLHIILTTTDLNTTPIFTGATLNRV